jgi:hypothetical protein
VIRQAGLSDGKTELSLGISQATFLRLKPLHLEPEDSRRVVREPYRDAKLPVVDEAKPADGRPNSDAAEWALADGFPVDYGRAKAPACQAPPRAFFPDAEGLLERCEPTFRSVGLLIEENEALPVGVETCRAVSASHHDAGCAAVENVLLSADLLFSREDFASPRRDIIASKPLVARLRRAMTIRPEIHPAAGKHDKASPNSAAGRLRKNVTIPPENHRAVGKHDKASRNSAGARLTKNVAIRPEIRRRDAKEARRWLSAGTSRRPTGPWLQLGAALSTVQNSPTFARKA